MSNNHHILLTDKPTEILGEVILEDFIHDKSFSSPLSFSNCTFHKNVKIKTSGKIELIACAFLGESTEIETVHNRNIEIKDSSFSNLTIKSASNVKMQDNTVNDKLIFTETNYNKIDIVNGNESIAMINSINFSKNKVVVKNFYSRNLNVLKVVYFNEINAESLQINGGELNEVNLSFATITSLVLQGMKPVYNELYIHNLNCSGVSVQKEMHLSTFEINDFKLNGFSKLSESKVKLYNILFKGRVEANHSNFDQVEFWGIDFYGTELLFESSNLQNATFANINWPKDRALSPNLVSVSWKSLFKKKKEKEPIETYNFQIESYRQLKNASLKNNNTIDALGFYKNEMRVYYTYAVQKKSESWWDRVLIWLNRAVSNFGQSYTRPLLWLFAVHYLFYQIIFDWQFHFDKHSLIKGAGDYFFLLNPIHKFPVYYSGLDFVTDFFMRVLGGFFIYHFIKASRKFGKV